MRFPKATWKTPDGRVRLYRGDCMEWFPRLPKAWGDAIVTDPPYGTTDAAWDKAVDWSVLWPMLDAASSAETVVTASFAAQPFATDLINSDRRRFRYELVWDKGTVVGFLNANRQPLRQHELVLIFARRSKGSVYNPQFTEGAPYTVKNRADRSTLYRSHGASRTTKNPGIRYPTSVLRFKKQRKHHPTSKPVALCEWLIRTYSREGALVADPFLGSGSTGVAAIQTGRRFVGIEREPGYFDTAVDRIKEALRQEREAA